MKLAILLSEIFIIAAVLSYLAIPLVKWLAVKNGLYDVPTTRKIHKDNIPRLGGVAIFGSFFFCLLLYQLSAFSFVDAKFPLLALPSAILMFLLGFYDDVLGVRSYRKLAFQVAAALCAYFLGFRITEIQLFGHVYALGIAGFFLTLGWIVFITNAFNLIDGLDGLAGGVGIIALVAIAFFGVIHGNFALTLTAFVLAGALLGFLQYNFSPASIFMGDSGSYFVGFMLSVLSIEMLNTGPATTSLFVPLLILSLPIFDTSLAIARRFLKYAHFVSGEGRTKAGLLLFVRRILAADSEHIHHILLNRGWTQKAVAIRLYWVAGALAFIGMFVPYLDVNGCMGLITILSMAATLTAFKMGIGKYLGNLIWNQGRRPVQVNGQANKKTAPRRQAVVAGRNSSRPLEL